MSEAVITPEVAKQLVSAIGGENLTNLTPTLEGAIKAFNNQQAEKALQMVAGEVIPFSPDDVDGVLLENLSSQEKDPNTGQKNKPDANTPEGKRYNETQETAQAIRKYLENLDPKTSPPDELINITISYLTTSPAFRELVIDQSGKFDDDKAKNIAKHLLRQPQVREAVRRLYVERLDPLKQLPHEKEVIQLRREIERIKEELGYGIAELIREKRDELIKLMGEIQSDDRFTQYESIRRELEQFNRKKQTLEKQLERLKASRPTRAANEAIEAEIASINQELKQLDIDYSAKEGELEAMQSDPNNRDFFDKIQQLAQLNQEIVGLEQQQRSIDPKRRNELTQLLAEKEAELQEAESLLLAERIKYAGEIQAIVPEALKSYLDEAFASARKSYEEEAKKVAEKTESANKERLTSATNKIVSRLGRKETRWKGADVYIPDKKSAWGVLSKLLSPGGIEQLFDPNNGELRLDETYLTTTYGLSKEEATAFIDKVSNDPQYRNEIAKNMAVAVFADYIGTGGRLSEKIVLALTSTDWGKDLLTKGQNLINERRQELEKKFGKGIISRVDELKGKSGEWIKENWKSAALIILLILLLIGGMKLGGVKLPGLG